MKKKRVFLVVSSFCLFVLAFSSFHCSSDSGSVTGSTDLDALVRSNASGLNFVLTFDEDMDTRFPPGTEVASAGPSFFSPPSAQANEQFRACLYLKNVQREAALKRAVWTSKKELLVMMTLPGSPPITVNGILNRNTCDQSGRFRTPLPAFPPQQVFSFPSRAAANYSEVSRVLIFVTPKVLEP